MANFYVIISHHIEGNRDNFFHNIQHQRRELSIGWSEFNPIGLDYAKIKDEIIKHYPDMGGTNAPDNGGKSLGIFANLKPGDIVFVRGEAKIVETIIVDSISYYDFGGGHFDNGLDYCLKVKFKPFFESKPLSSSSEQIKEDGGNDLYSSVFYEGGRSLVIRKLEDNNAFNLMKILLERS